MLSLSLFNVARSLADSLRGPVLQTSRRARRTSLMGRVGRVDGHQKCPLIFFILRYIKHCTHIYLYTKGKLSGQISCGFIFWSSWGVAPTIFKITILRQFFF